MSILTNSNHEETQEYKHEHKEQLCYYTNELYPKEEIIKYTMRNRGYGSIFDCDSYKIQLHKDVAKELEDKGVLKAEWFDNDKMLLTDEEMFEDYAHEKDINKFIESLNVYNREYIQNCNNWFLGKMDRNDWIEMFKEQVENNLETCNYCKDILDCDSPYNIPWYEDGIWKCYNNDNFYLIPQLDGKQEGCLRPCTEINHCPKCGRLLC